MLQVLLFGNVAAEHKMNPRLLLNLLLLLCIAAVSLFIINSPDDREPNITRLGGPSLTEINNILIQSDGLVDIQLKKTNAERWLMTVPYKVEANPASIDEIIKLTNAISHSRFSAINKNLSDYDLQPAKASLHLNDEEYLFGNIESINKRRYILKDKTIHLTTDLFYHRLRTNAESFIRPQLIPDGTKLIALKSSELNLNKSAKGEWIISENKSTAEDYSADAIQTLLDHWQHKRAIQILPANPPENSQQVSITLSDNSEINYHLVTTTKESIFIRSDLGLQYHLPVSAADDLLSLTK